MTEPTHRRAITNGPVEIDLGGEIGTQPLRYDDDSLIALELKLDDLLDKVNGRLEGRGEEPFESVWEALEEITARYPVASIKILLSAGLPPGTPVPLSALGDDGTAQRIMEALSIAFGEDPAEPGDVPRTEEVHTDPTDAGGDAGGSTGDPSTPSGPAPSRPEV